MPQWRKLHVKTTESLDINDMPDDFTRLMWVMLPLGSDSEGRGLDNPAWIKSKIFPLRSDVDIAMIENAMSWFAVRKMIERYQVNGRHYFCIPTFHKYQGKTDREAESQYPAPPEKIPPGEQDNPGGNNGHYINEDNSRATQELVVTTSSSDSDSDSDSTNGDKPPAAQKKNTPKWQLMNEFTEYTGIPYPGNKQDQRYWWSRINAIYESANRDIDIGKHLIRESVDKLKGRELTISDPGSLVKTIRSLVADSKPKRMVLK